MADKPDVRDRFVTKEWQQGNYIYRQTSGELGCSRNGKEACFPHGKSGCLRWNWWTCQSSGCRGVRCSVYPKELDAAKPEHQHLHARQISGRTWKRWKLPAIGRRVEGKAEPRVPDPGKSN